MTIRLTALLLALLRSRARARKTVDERRLRAAKPHVSLSFKRASHKPTLPFANGKTPEGLTRGVWTNETLVKPIAIGDRVEGVARFLNASARGAEDPNCPTLACPRDGARYTGRYAIFMAGQIRTAYAMLEKAIEIIDRRYSGDVRVDWYFHVWYNASSVCEARALNALRVVATAVTTEPIECMWSWGNAFQDQWHSVSEGFATLEQYARPSKYTLILKSRPDIRYEDFDFERLWRTYSKRSPNGHFAVFSRAQGWDLNVAATPPLAKGLAATPVLPCEAAYDAFPWLRMKRHGVWPPEGEHEVDVQRWVRSLNLQGAPRCAPLFDEHWPSLAVRPKAGQDSLRTGCLSTGLVGMNGPPAEWMVARGSFHRGQPDGRAPSSTRPRRAGHRRRRLGVNKPKEWRMPPKERCRERHTEVFFVKGRGAQPPELCPPHCSADVLARAAAGA